jgi:hypothetical protein
MKHYGILALIGACCAATTAWADCRVEVADAQSGHKISAANKSVWKKAEALFPSLEYADLSRGAGTILPRKGAQGDQPRVDMQGRTKTHYNLQVQVGKSTIAGVLLAHALAEGAQNDAERAAIAEHVRAAFAASYQDGRMKQVDGACD